MDNTNISEAQLIQMRKQLLARTKRLSDAQVIEIRHLHSEGYTQGSIAKHFGVSIGTIGRIVRYEVHQRVEGSLPNNYTTP